MVSLVTNTNPEGPFPICLKTDQRNWLLGVHRDLRTHNHYRLSYWVTLVNTLLQMSVLLCLPTMVHKKRALTLLALLFSCFFFFKKKTFIFFHMYECSAYMYVVYHECPWTESKTVGPLVLEFQLWAALWVLGIKPKFWMSSSSQISLTSPFLCFLYFCLFMYVL